MVFVNFLFIASAILTLGCAFLVLFTKNLMHSCIYLLGSLLGVAGLYATIGADFIAVTQIMVYVGGIVILMLFAIMLTGGKDFISRAQSLLGLIPSMGNKFSYTIGFLVALVFLLINVKILSRVFSMDLTQKTDLTILNSTVSDIGMLLVKDHVLVFELSSVLLLGALVGAAIIARPKKNEKV